ncbi:aspartate kinase [Fodinibius sp. Rm-B-1B1-1]|uniref:aspartate kinase n=1 Tax=Fodinibius alkaliphilus TaxID=3140241 RepID=UPI00315A9BDF
MKVLKFGGTSMGDAQTWKRVIEIIKTYDAPFVVVSATARTTRALVKAAHKAIDNPQEANDIAHDIATRHNNIVEDFLTEYDDSSQTLEACYSWIDIHIKELKQHLTTIHNQQELTEQLKDVIASIGERLSSYLFTECGYAAGLFTTWLDATKIIRTDSNFGKASPNVDFIFNKITTLQQKISTGNIPVMGGYYGMDANENITTLGFEGSDYSASLIGAALNADAIEIWTDVSGVYTCDPRFVENAQPIPQLSFQEATELAYFGAKVLHPSTTKPASKQGIPIHVKNIFDPKAPGTCISSESTNNQLVKAITYKEHGTIITVTSSQTVMGYEFLADVFDVLRWHQLPVDVVTTTEASVSIAIENGDQIDKAITQLQAHGIVTQRPEQGIISLVGCQNSDRKLIGDILREINDIPLNMISYSKSKGNLNIVVDTKDTLPSVKKIHKKLFS